MVSGRKKGEIRSRSRGLASSDWMGLERAQRHPIRSRRPRQCLRLLGSRANGERKGRAAGSTEGIGRVGSRVPVRERVAGRGGGVTGWSPWAPIR